MIESLLLSALSRDSQCAECNCWLGTWVSRWQPLGGNPQSKPPVQWSEPCYWEKSPGGQPLQVRSLGVTSLAPKANRPFDLTFRLSLSVEYFCRGPPPPQKKKLPLPLFWFHRPRANRMFLTMGRAPASGSTRGRPRGLPKIWRGQLRDPSAPPFGKQRKRRTFWKLQPWKDSSRREATNSVTATGAGDTCFFFFVGGGNWVRWHSPLILGGHALYPKGIFSHPPTLALPASSQKVP